MPFETMKFKMTGNILRDAAARKLEAMNTIMKDGSERVKRIQNKYTTKELNGDGGDDQALKTDIIFVREFDEKERSWKKEKELLEFFRDNMNQHVQYEMCVEDLIYLGVRFKE